MYLVNQSSNLNALNGTLRNWGHEVIICAHNVLFWDSDLIECSCFGSFTFRLSKNVSEWNYGYSSSLMPMPSERFMVIIMSNCNNPQFLTHSSCYTSRCKCLSSIYIFTSEYQWYFCLKSSLHTLIPSQFQSSLFNAELRLLLEFCIFFQVQVGFFCVCQFLYNKNVQ